MNSETKCTHYFHWVIYICVYFFPFRAPLPCDAPLSPSCGVANSTSSWLLTSTLSKTSTFLQRYVFFKKSSFTSNYGPLHWSVKYSPNYTHWYNLIIRWLFPLSLSLSFFLPLPPSFSESDVFWEWVLILCMLFFCFVLFCFVGICPWSWFSYLDSHS